MANDNLTAKINFKILHYSGCYAVCCLLDNTTAYKINARRLKLASEH